MIDQAMKGLESAGRIEKMQTPQTEQIKPPTSDPNKPKDVEPQYNLDNLYNVIEK